MLLREVKAIFHKELEETYPKEEVAHFFHVLVEHCLKLERFVLVLHPNHTLTKAEEQPLFEALSRLKSEEPLQYITGEAWFMDLELGVDKNVLIPRPETEELVQWILEDVQEFTREIRILDVGTGSGCIAIALAKQLPNAQVYAIDVSAEALLVAKENAERNQVEVQFLRGDILDQDLDLSLEFDLIVSNPPYVREQEKVEMKNNVKHHEPPGALYVPNNDALRFYRATLHFAVTHLKSDGGLYFEINQYLALEMENLMKAGGYGEIALRKDIFGNFRMLKAIKK